MTPRDADRVVLRAWNLRDAFVRFFRGQTRNEAGELTPDVARVMADLNEFAFASASCVMFDKDGRVDPIATARNEGRREVLLRIEQHLAVTDAELHKLRRILNPDDDTEE